MMCQWNGIGRGSLTWRQVAATWRRLLLLLLMHRLKLLRGSAHCELYLILVVDLLLLMVRRLARVHDRAARMQQRLSGTSMIGRGGRCELIVRVHVQVVRRGVHDLVQVDLRPVNQARLGLRCS